MPGTIELPDRSWSEAAELAYTGLRRHFSADHDLYLGSRDGRGERYAYVWPHSQVLACLIDMAGLPGGRDNYEADLRQAVRGLENYLDRGRAPMAYDSAVRRPLGPGGTKFYDDNEWIALALLDWFEMSGEEWSLEVARGLFDFVVEGWDPGMERPSPGGVRWAEGSLDRNTVSTAAGAQLGLRLYTWLGSEARLECSVRMYEWVERTLKAPDGLYWDHLDGRGRIDHTKWSYNQGLMIGLACLLHRATGETSYLQSASETTDSSLRHYDSQGWSSQPVVFNAIFRQNLNLLERSHPGRRTSAALLSYGGELERALDRSTGLVAPPGGGTLELLGQAGVVRLFSQLHLAD